MINESMNDGGDCRTAPATPVLLNILHHSGFTKFVQTLQQVTQSEAKFSL